jgi:PEP-CTERM motif
VAYLVQGAEVRYSAQGGCEMMQKSPSAAFTFVRRSRSSAIQAILVGLALTVGYPALFECSAQAATVFSTYTGAAPPHDLGGGRFLAQGFTSGGDYDFTGAAAFVSNSNESPELFVMALYASTSEGAPGSSPLWTSGLLSAPSGGPTVISGSDSGSPILLGTAHEYFLVLDLPTDTAWTLGGSASSPYYVSADGSTWISVGSSEAQYEVYGSAIPEPATWVMLLAGFGGLGLVGMSGLRRTGETAAA